MGSAWLIYPETMCHTCAFSVASNNPPSRTLRARAERAYALNVREKQFRGKKWVQHG